ncbi:MULTISPECIES: efflux RND transporter permease subunit [unclassified Dyella]|uniref:efflux RND transporter permease subunit n=1 Tax=unclassified Dyella TaxID=2634549 RepID=UPI000C81AAC6|nr:MULTISPECIES: efflux RND transporter permease subunit [unclassified Dyella]MDR3447093.1 efflux RND transporter permease subunit [Dyella sp.]PMQ04848.1 Cobalt-zinc-cadmium resistance protein CzcA [Dyella sp. AD56]
MSLPTLLARHARAIVIVAFALAIAGLASSFTLPVGLFPQVSFPRVVVDLDAGDRPADQTALLLTRPVEEAIRTVPGVAGLRSETTRGSAQISVDFGWGRDMIASTLQVDSAIARVLPSLPAGATYNVRRMDPTVYPIISYALQSDTLSPVALRDLAQYQIVPLLASVLGLARVDVQGGETAEVEVEADPRKLAQYGLSLDDLATAVNGANQLEAVGRLQDRNQLYLVVADHSLQRLDAIRNIIVKNDAHGWVRLSDVATIRDGYVPQWVKVSEDGKPAVLFNVYEQPDGNAVQIAGQVRDKLAAFRLPKGVKLTPWYDQSELVVESAHSVRDAVLIGLLLAAAVLLLFLRNLRVTLIAMLVVPVTLAVTALLLQIFGMSFNIMTLGGIAAAVGLVIDDVIVMVEHVARRAGAADGGGEAAVLPAAREFLAPLTGSSLATLIVFVPLGLLSGVTGAFSKALSVTMACALVVSWLVSAFVVPPLLRRWVDFRRWHDPGLAHESWLARSHARLYDAFARRPAWLLAMVIPLLVLGGVAYTHVATGFMPSVDESGFVMDYYTKPGTSLPETARQVGQVESILRSMPEVDTFSRRLGTGLGGDLGQSYHGDFFVRLKPGHKRATEEVMSDVREHVEHEVPGVEVELAQLMEDLIGDLTAVPQPIEIKLYSADPKTLVPQAQRVAKAIADIPGVVEIKDGVQLAGDALNVQIDPDKATLEGMTVATVTLAINNALTGVVATQLPQETKSVGVRIRMPDAMQWRLPQLLALPVRAPDGHVFPLSRVASIVTENGQPQISRENLQQMVAVTARIDGRGMGAAVADVKKLLAQPGVLDADTRYELGGLYQQQQIAFLGLGKVFLMALVAEFVLLLFLYGRPGLALVVMGCSLFSATAVFIALWLCGVDLNITAMMGMTMIIGMGTEMAIFYVSEYVTLAQGMPPLQALRMASRDRLRPITMTTLAAILTLLPLALAWGQGSGIQQPLAIAIIAGLTLQYPLVLLVMPTLIGLAMGHGRHGDDGTAVAT